MTEADALEAELMEKAKKLAALRRAEPPVEIDDYAFETLDGETRLSALFAGRERLLAIHNMGQGCRYCTLWADGFNGLVPHLEDAMAVVLLSKDPPETQRRFAQSRGWRFRMASHGGGPYMKEQGAMQGYDNCPAAVVYEHRDGKILRRARTGFGPGDLYSPMWHLLALAGIGENEWTPQFHYWRRPGVMEDGGANLRD
jgi:predicted dithiol-disulfide oxidoreductase (DUF899 family)